VVVSTGDPRARDEWQLVISAAPGVLRRNVQPGVELVLGRGDQVDIDVHDDSVSRRHARLRIGDPLHIEDLGSRNGTFVHGRRLAAGEAATVPLGSVVELGSTFFVVYRGSLADGLAANPPSTAMLVVGETMQRLYALLDTVAPSKLSLLVLGETGTGKEVYARALHARSDRAARPFVALNCASLVESLLESELFGHEKGAFTGAAEAKPGLLEMADGGTVFLDEIGELPPTTQAKLLRVLENGELLRVGGLKPRRIDVRLVAATNADLDAAIAAGRFRRDLYYRINGCVVTLPPLRERPGEILPLARHFAAALGRTRFTDAAERALRDHVWPGNVRELKTVIERAALLSARGGAIDAADLMLAPRRASPTAPAGVAPHEREQLLEALQRANGNQKEAAKLLGLSRQTLSKKLDAHGIGRPRKGG
jgi:two-component system response regulator AtoC